MAFIEHKNGKTAWTGSYAYHDNGETAWTGSYAYYDNGATAWTGSHAYHRDGTIAWTGSYAYDQKGNTTDINAASIKLNLGPEIDIEVSKSLVKLTIYKTPIAIPIHTPPK